MVALSRADANLPPNSPLITVAILAAVVKSALCNVKRKFFFAAVGVEVFLDRRAVNDAAYGRKDLATTVRGRTQAYGSLCNGVNVLIPGPERSDQQYSTLEITGIADRTDRDINVITRASERRKLGGHDDGGGVL